MILILVAFLAVLTAVLFFFIGYHCGRSDELQTLRVVADDHVHRYGWPHGSRKFIEFVQTERT